jgi:2-octaprenyl-6-methoxyphenol hydroxylase
MSEQVDIIIVGGGPVGATLALALKDSGLKVCLLEARSEVGRSGDPRALALSYGSMLLLRRLGVWQRLAVQTPIETIHVSQRGGFGRAVLQAKDENLPAFGWVVDYTALDAALHDVLRENGSVRYLTDATVKSVSANAEAASADYEQDGATQQLAAKLLVLADGGHSLAESLGISRKIREYGQNALVANVTMDLPHHNTAYERFTPEGPMALLPTADGYALVWTTSPEKAQSLCELDDTSFLAKLYEHFGARAGHFTAVGRRAHFPLALRYTRPAIANRVALVGNAAQTLHPVAGQGFNLGLRDAWEFAAEILHTPCPEIGCKAMLERYRASRRLDSGATMLASDLLVRGFSNHLPLLSSARGLLLTAMDVLPPVKSAFARRMIFGARG